MRALRLPLASLLAALCCAAPARANPLDAYGFGSRSPAMGGAVAADTKDSSANYYNPAGLVRAEHLAIEIGYRRAEHYLKMNGLDNGIEAVHGLDVGLVAPGKIRGIPVALGVALQLPDERLWRIRALRQEEPRWELYDNRNHRMFVAANVAVSPWDWLQIGGGAAVMAAMSATLDITGGLFVADPSKSQLRHEIDASSVPVVYPQLGARVAVSKDIAFALVYRGEFHMSLDVTTGTVLDVQQLTTARYLILTQGVDAFLPQQVVLGWSWAVVHELHANLDLTWVNWGAYQASNTRLDVSVDVPPPPGGFPPNIVLPTAAPPTTLLPVHLVDRLDPHLGVEWRALARPKYDLFVRGGYELHRSPFPEARGYTNYIDRDRHAFATGAGVSLHRPVAVIPGDIGLDLHLQWSVLPTKTTLKDSPADVVGDFTAGGHIWNVGGTLSFGF
jgi:long-chain fatty acid transport protein